MRLLELILRPKNPTTQKPCRLLTLTKKQTNKVKKAITINYVLRIVAYHDTTTDVVRLLNMSDVYLFYIC